MSKFKYKLKNFVGAITPTNLFTVLISVVTLIAGFLISKAWDAFDNQTFVLMSFLVVEFILIAITLYICSSLSTTINTLKVFDLQKSSLIYESIEKHITISRNGDEWISHVDIEFDVRNNLSTAYQIFNFESWTNGSGYRGGEQDLNFLKNLEVSVNDKSVALKKGSCSMEYRGEGSKMPNYVKVPISVHIDPDEMKCIKVSYDTNGFPNIEMEEGTGTIIKELTHRFKIVIELNAKGYQLEQVMTQPANSLLLYQYYVTDYHDNIMTAEQQELSKRNEKPRLRNNKLTWEVYNPCVTHTYTMCFKVGKEK